MGSCVGGIVAQYVAGDPYSGDARCLSCPLGCEVDSVVGMEIGRPRYVLEDIDRRLNGPRRGIVEEVNGAAFGKDLSLERLCFRIRLSMEERGEVELAGADPLDKNSRLIDCDIT